MKNTSKIISATPIKTIPPIYGTHIKGIAWIFFGAIAFSTKAILVKLAYRYDVDSISLLALRMLFALPIYIAIYFLTRKKEQQQTTTQLDYLKVIGIGITGYYLASLFDFMGLQFVTAGIERLVLYAYPSLVVVISFVLFKKKIALIQFVALLLTYIGIGIAFVDKTAAAESANLYLGASLVFLAALSYAFYIAISGSLIPKVGVKTFTIISMCSAAAVVLLHHTLVLQLQLFHFHPQVYLFAALMAIFATVIPSFMIAEGIRIIGANNAAIVGSVGPVSTILLAFLILGESFGPLQLLGTVIVILGVVTLSLSKGR